MLIADRRKQLTEYIEKQGKATVSELSKVFFASEPTIRRDLTELEKSGIIEKVYGGAMVKGAADREIPMTERESSALLAKDIIAKKAADLVKDGDVIILDGSSSAKAIVKYLTVFKDIIVITSGAKTAVELAQAGIRTFCTGGRMITRSFSYVGKHAQDYIAGLNADILFFSCHGLEGDYATDLSSEETELRRVMMKHAKKKVLLCDKSKMGKTYLYNVCNINEVDKIISE